jgi:hypothetical protein
MKRILLAVLLVAMAVPACGDGLNYERSEENKRAAEGPFPKECKQGLEDFYALMRANPFDTKGRCFKTTWLNTLQILSRSKALFQIAGSYEPFAMIDFGKDSAPAGYFTGVVKGGGAFQYTAANGRFITVHKLSVVKTFERSR